MKYAVVTTALALAFFNLTSAASARDVVLPAGTLLQCTMSEPNFSSTTADVGDPVLCHLHGTVEFGQQAFPRGTYLVGHLEAEKDPGHFFGKGYLKLQFDRIGLPSGDLPLETKIIATRGYKVDREGKIDGKGHLKRDIVEWMLPPLWPWKVMMLPARGPRPALKGESTLSLRLMDDVQLPQSASLYGPGWRSFGRPQSESFQQSLNGEFRPQLAVREVAEVAYQAPDATPQAAYASLISPTVQPDTLAAEVRMAAPGVPVFVLKSGTLLSVSSYGYRDSRITYTLAAGGAGVISTDEVDWSTTTKVNAQRGVRVTLGGGRAHTETPGL
jgi:hypothetical protein